MKVADIASQPFADSVVWMKRSTKIFAAKVIGVIVIYLVLSWFWNYKFLGVMS